MVVCSFACLFVYFSLGLLAEFCQCLTMHGSDTLKSLEIPQLNGHVCRTGGQELATVVERNILHRVCVALQGSFKITRLVIPYLNRVDKGEMLNISLASLFFFFQASPFFFQPPTLHMARPLTSCFISIEQKIALL